MARAVCLKCGTTKATAWERCRNCGFDPTRAEDALVKSVYLSVGRYEAEEEQDTYEKQLDVMAAAIRSGEGVRYDVSELQRLRNQKRAVEAAEPWTIVWRLFLPAGILIGGLLIAYVILRMLR